MLSRLLTLLQFTRLALVFTAVSNGWAALILQAHARQRANDSLVTHFDPRWAVAMTGVSVGLYAFGMTLNDIIDRRRDTQIAAHRPLPSGKLGVRPAQGICVLLALLALGCGLYLARVMPGGRAGFVVLLATMGGIVFYDLAGKYLVGPGLLALGLIRFGQATIPATEWPVVWHPLFLLFHVTLLSTACYVWEGKRPRISRRNLATVIGGLLVVAAGVIAWTLERHGGAAQWRSALALSPALLWPVGAAGAFCVVLWQIKRTARDPRAAGRSAMLYGLLWLILYDAAFVYGYVGLLPAGVVLLLLPVAFLSVRVMRWWAQLVELSAKPQYQRAR